MLAIKHNANLLQFSLLVALLFHSSSIFETPITAVIVFGFSESEGTLRSGCLEQSANIKTEAFIPRFRCEHVPLIMDTVRVGFQVRTSSTPFVCPSTLHLSMASHLRIRLNDAEAFGYAYTTACLNYLGWLYGDV